MNRVATAAVLGTLVGLGLGWGLFGGPGVPESPGSERGDGAREAGALAAGREVDDKDASSAAASETARASVGPRSRRLPGASTAAGRRVLAARKGNLLVEFPDWNDRLTLRDGVAAEQGLDAARVQELEELYAATNARLRESLQKLYTDLVGDPEAGRTSTLNALLHDVMSLSPQEACNQRLPALLQALAEELPLPALGPDPLPCAAAVQLVFQTVDRLDEQVVQIAGESARKALWSGSSTFEFGSAKAAEPR